VHKDADPEKNLSGSDQFHMKNGYSSSKFYFKVIGHTYIFQQKSLKNMKSKNFFSSLVFRAGSGII
jgi:hypothetical protein